MEIARKYNEQRVKQFGFRCLLYAVTTSKVNFIDYVSNEDELIDPVLYWGSWEASKMYREHTIVAHNLFKDLLRVGVCREQARGVLPQNLYTEYYGTVNLNNLLKFIELRTHEGAQWEIQKVAEACLEIATELWPITVASYRELRHK